MTVFPRALPIDTPLTHGSFTANSFYIPSCFGDAFFFLYFLYLLSTKGHVAIKKLLKPSAFWRPFIHLIEHPIAENEYIL